MRPQSFLWKTSSLLPPHTPTKRKGIKPASVSAVDLSEDPLHLLQPMPATAQETCLYFSKMKGVLDVSGLHSTLPLDYPSNDHPFHSDSGHSLVGRGPCEVAAAARYL